MINRSKARMHKATEVELLPLVPLPGSEPPALQNSHDDPGCWAQLVLLVLRDLSFIFDILQRCCGFHFQTVAAEQTSQRQEVVRERDVPVYVKILDSLKYSLYCGQLRV